MASNLGKVVADAWEKYIKASLNDTDVKSRDPFLLDLFKDGRGSKTRKLSKRQLKKIDRDYRAAKRKEKKELAKYLGTVVKAEGDPYGHLILTYKDGRKLNLYSEQSWDDE